MELYAVARDVPQRGAGNLVAIGKWDGVHLAHQAIIKTLVSEARRTGGQSVVMGFHPLPMQVLRPREAPPVLQTLEERAETLSALGVDVHLAVAFDPAFAGLSPEAFVREVLVETLKAREVMVGFNFTFAKGGAGTSATLRALCDQYGIPVQVFPPVRIDGENVSSTEVRFNVAAGEMERTAKLLGRPFALTGEVIRGDGRGRTLGFPTANVFLAPGRLLPATGVYAARATVLDPTGTPSGDLPREVAPRTGQTYGAVLNLGRRPTFQGTDLRCEVHLLDFTGDLYGRELRVEFLNRLRGEQPFKSIDALKAQLAADVAATRAYL
ncbi:MAG TPA: bifunctional riboflavin kinase/FAD synthetase [Symbiobacteriaceae bacterium]|jgi:riboflavin kinase/FMN adenylyltransferase